MSLDYASALSEYENKGVCGIPEIHDPDYIFEQKVNVLTDLLRRSTYTVVHTGAGLSTAAGIPDFRGPNGVWTLEKEGKKPTFNKSFIEARPSVGHLALVALEEAGYINFVITQNIDGLHLRSGFPRNRLSILHGDVFMEKCSSCDAIYVRSTKIVPTFGLKTTGSRCTKMKTRVRPCGGKLRDSVLDWEDELPDPDYGLAIKMARNAHLHLCLGTSPLFLPSALLPFRTAALGVPRMHYRYLTKSESSLTDSSANASIPVSCEPFLTANPHITECQIDEFISKYLASGNEGLSSMYLASPLTKRFKWTRHSRGKPDAATAVTVARNGRKKSRKADLHICMGTSLQIHPAADLPFRSKQGAARYSRKRKHPCGENLKTSDIDSSTSSPSLKYPNLARPSPKVVIVNLQPTKFDSRADICLRSEIDRVLTQVCQNLGVEIPKVESQDGPFIPRIVLRSKHTAESEPFPWVMLSHPDNAVSPFASGEIGDDSLKTELPEEMRVDYKKESRPSSECKPVTENLQ